MYSIFIPICIYPLRITSVWPPRGLTRCPTSLDVSTMSTPTEQPLETAPLLNANGNHETTESRPLGTPPTKARITVWAVLTLIFVLMLVVFVGFQDLLSDGIKTALGIPPKDPIKAAHFILDRAPVIVSSCPLAFRCLLTAGCWQDGHIDLPQLARLKYANNVSAINLSKEMPGQVDIPRLRKGKVGGLFWLEH